MAVGEH